MVLMLKNTDIGNVTTCTTCFIVDAVMNVNDLLKRMDVEGVIVDLKLS